jgi:cyclic pyranopterin phosphate synthase
MPPHGVILKNRNRILSYEEIVLIVREAVKCEITKVRLTGGEPLVRKDICQLIRDLRVIKGLKEITLTTNGILLESMADELKNSGLDRINISLDTLDPEKYRKITRGGDLGRVLKGIEAVQKAGFTRTKLNMVLIPGLNDEDVNKIKDFCWENALVLQRINHYSLNSRKNNQSDAEAERPLPCDFCNRIRLTADGKLKPCLFSDQEIDVDFEDIAGSLRKAILNKPEEGQSCTIRGNWEIGG